MSQRVPGTGYEVCRTSEGLEPGVDEQVFGEVRGGGAQSPCSGHLSFAFLFLLKRV